MPIAFRDQVSRVNVTGATLAQNTMPTHADKDLLLWFTATTAASQPSLSVPAGWSQLGAAANAAGAGYVVVFFKIASSSSEAAPTTTITASGSIVSSCTMLSYSGARATFDTSNVWNATNQFGATSYGVVQPTSTVKNCMVITAVQAVAYANAAQPLISWPSSTERAESSTPYATTMYGGSFAVADKFQAAIGPAGTETVTFSPSVLSTTVITLTWPSAPEDNRFFAMF